MVEQNFYNEEKLLPRKIELNIFHDTNAWLGYGAAIRIYLQKDLTYKSIDLFLNLVNHSGLEYHIHFFDSDASDLTELFEYRFDESFGRMISDDDIALIFVYIDFSIRNKDIPSYKELIRIASMAAPKKSLKSLKRISNLQLNFHIAAEFQLYSARPLNRQQVIKPVYISQIPNLFLTAEKQRWLDFAPTNKISNIVTNFRKNTILVLGKDSPLDESMKRIIEILKENSYTPILLRNITNFPIQSLEEKLTYVGLLSRFVIVEDSIASGVIDETNILARNNLIIIRLFKESIATKMQGDYEIRFPFLKEFQYGDNLEETLVDALQWAENMVDKKAKMYNKRIPL